MPYDGRQLERELIRGALNEREQALLDMMFFTGPDEEKSRALFDGLDLDTESVVFQLILAVWGNACGWKDFPAEILPRIRGVYRYYQVDCGMKYTWLAGVLRALEEAGIRAMLLKGGAMYVYYRRGSSRMMDDFDLAVPEKDFDRAAAIIASMGCERDEGAPWSSTFLAKVYGRYTYLDLHKRIFKYSEGADAQLWARAVPVEFQGARVLVPCPEDMLFHMLDNQARNYFINEHPERRIKWIFDCCTVWDQYPAALRPERLRELSVPFCNTRYVQLALRILAARLPGLFPAGKLEESFPADRAYYTWIARGIAYRDAHTAARKYPDGASLTPRYLLTTARRWVTQYRLLRPDLREQYGHITFLRFFLRQSECGTLGGALRRYIPRLSLRNGPPPSD